jgi:hypothetical protein
MQWDGFYNIILAQAKLQNLSNSFTAVSGTTMTMKTNNEASRKAHSYPEI